MKKQTAYIFAAFVLVLLIIAGITAWALGFFDSAEKAPEPTEPATESEMPFDLPTAAPTATPQPIATPAPTATPTPTPEPSSAPSGKMIASGAFDSATGTGINTRTQWTATESGDSSVLLTLKVYVRSYSVSIGARGYTVTIDGVSASGMTRAVEVDSANSVVETLLFTYSTEIDLSAGQSTQIPVSVDWKYDGQYSGQTLDVIHSETSLSISR